MVYFHFGDLGCSFTHSAHTSSNRGFGSVDSAGGRCCANSTTRVFSNRFASRRLPCTCRCNRSTFPVTGDVPSTRLTHHPLAPGLHLDAGRIATSSPFPLPSGVSSVCHFSTTHHLRHLPPEARKPQLTWAITNYPQSPPCRKGLPRRSPEQPYTPWSDGVSPSGVSWRCVIFSNWESSGIPSDTPSPTIPRNATGPATWTGPATGRERGFLVTPFFVRCHHWKEVTA